jgi:hypothetical protein
MNGTPIGILEKCWINVANALAGKLDNEFILPMRWNLTSKLKENTTSIEVDLLAIED